MNAVLVENMPSKIINKFGEKIDYNILYTYIQAENEKGDLDFNFTDYDNMTISHKKEYDKLKNINKDKLLNI